MGTGPRPEGRGGGLGREVRWSEVAGLVAGHRTGLILGIGAALRVAQYLSDRPYWMDEAALAGNVLGRSLADLFGPMLYSQLAPPGFLVLEWLAVRALGEHIWSLRLVPLVAGVASLFLFARLSRRCLGPTAAWVALAMFAVSDDLIYYATELKPYSSDVAVSLACGLMGAAMAEGRAPARRLAAWAALGAAAVWFALPSPFVLAGAGVVAVAASLGRRAWGEAAGLGAVVGAWLASFAGAHAVALRLLGDGAAGMGRFWAVAFPPAPGSAAGYAAWGLRKALYLFVNPLDFATPLGPIPSMLPAVVLFGIGCGSLARRDGRSLARLLLPVGLALAASALRLYPTHGRLALFLVPNLLIPIAEGAGWLRGRGARGAAWAAILAALLLAPSARAAFHVLEPRGRDSRNPYGDRRAPSLDPIWFPARGDS